MGEIYCAIRDIPQQGLNVLINDVAVWDIPLKEFNIKCRILVPMQAQLHLLLVQGGCLVRGKLNGQVVQACDLCAEDAPTVIDHEVESFQTIPGQSIDFEQNDDDFEDDDDVNDSTMDKDMHIIIDNNMPKLNLSSLCWEEFMLSLPMRPLCQSNCKGLCANCGANLNELTCKCGEEQGDPRLAVLRTLKIAKK